MRHSPSTPTTLTSSQIKALADLYGCSVSLGYSVAIEYDGKYFPLDAYAIIKSWTKEEWKQKFEEISGKKIANFWTSNTAIPEHRCAQCQQRHNVIHVFTEIGIGNKEYPVYLCQQCNKEKSK